jgi:PTS system nitrogen regulatory IIA component
VAAVGIKKGGLDFDSMDGQPSNIFILTVTPANRTGPHIQFLAEISRLLNDEAVRSRLLLAASDMELLDILTR